MQVEQEQKWKEEEEVCKGRDRKGGSVTAYGCMM